jgi:DNA primase
MNELVEAVRSQSPIEAVIAENVRLRRSGSQLLGLCPFHPDKTPSFLVSASKQTFFCHGCQKGGDVFSFVRYQFDCGFNNVLAHLARRAGIPLQGFQPSLELIERVARQKAERADQADFERFCQSRINDINSRCRALARAATNAEECLRSGALHDAEQELAWSALERFRSFEARVEREGMCDLDILRCEWLEQRQRGRYDAAA